MDRRKEELEKKRAKLAELRRAREERKHIQEAQRLPPPPLISTNRDRKAIDDLVSMVLGEQPSSTAITTTSSSDHGSDGGSDNVSSRPTSASFSSSPDTPITSTDTGTGHPFPCQVLATPQYVPELNEFQAIIADIPPLEQLVLSKEIQTLEGSLHISALSEEEIRNQVLAEYEQKEKERQAQLAEERRIAEEKKKPKEYRALSEEEASQIVDLPDFVEFVDTTSRIMERALNEPYDFMKDYTLGVDVDSDEKVGKRVKLVCDFWDEKLCKNRSVTGVDWSAKFPDYVVASYNKNVMAVNEPDGLSVIWNLQAPEKPEYVFHCQSDVLSVMFSKFHSHYVIGGTYSGQVVLWDTRAKSLPVLKTPLSAGGHTHPIYSLDMIGSQDAHTLISASTDGSVCSWQLDMLAQPQEYLELQHSAHNKTEEVAITCKGFPDDHASTSFWIGTEEGNIYQANRFDRAGSKAGINPHDIYRGHYGAITGLHFHPRFGPIDFSDLFLTSSVDWTVKLWNAKSTSKPSSELAYIHPLHSFEDADDYIYDVKWSPSHPALFASIDGAGQFDLWNLNADTEEPLISTPVGPGNALNKLAWDAEGRKTAIGSSDGKVYIHDIGEIATPKPDEWDILQKTIMNMKDNHDHDRK
ncbi:WD40-repeat-containing domain protein [Radiomyces spectabilis]|uniref:WD40-repeat-containing domain protein n=1 Tax=Radiomyces spectabilis TaxID=64574 RepID=UPI00221FECAC|nr:WD40-repeat-containing domain protein [Radiomyces spectabilis]KAI8393869.1 WD40-repeat-containing domain protein [Radiomyces spectabilis]